MNPLELTVVGALGTVGLALVAAAAVRARRRKRAPAQPTDARAPRRVHVDLGEDPIVAALGIGDSTSTRPSNGRR